MRSLIVLQTWGKSTQLVHPLEYLESSTGVVHIKQTKSPENSARAQLFPVV